LVHTGQARADESAGFRVDDVQAVPAGDHQDLGGIAVEHGAGGSVEHMVVRGHPGPDDCCHRPLGDAGQRFVMTSREEGFGGDHRGKQR
jgi:hypothetical protein